MSNTFFTSDTHFDHARIIELDNDPFQSMEERKEHILKCHNSVVKPGDNVWHLGDLSFSKEGLEWYLKNANGNIHLIRGNHDDKVAWRYRHLFASAHEALYLHKSEIGSSHSIYLSHYAMLRWRNSCHGSLHLFGHSHGKLRSHMPRSMDVGVRCNNYTPVSISDVVKKLSNQPPAPYED